MIVLVTETQFIVWRDIFAVGHRELDAEHRRLVGAINEIHSAECAERTPGQLRPMLNALFVAAEQHFEHENSVMRKIGPDAPVSSEAIDAHISVHERELSKLRSIIGSIGPVIDPIEPKLSYELRHWFAEHSIKYDAHLKMIFQSM
jgi:hemerythrin-like metal-binding protein